MLRKMLKYDLKAMAKTFIPFYAVILLMSVLNIIFIRAEWTPGMVSGTLIYVCLFMALAVVAVVRGHHHLLQVDQHNHLAYLKRCGRRVVHHDSRLWRFCHHRRIFLRLRRAVWRYRPAAHHPFLLWGPGTDRCCAGADVCHAAVLPLQRAAAHLPGDGLLAALPVQQEPHRRLVHCLLPHQHPAEHPDRCAVFGDRVCR